MRWLAPWADPLLLPLAALLNGLGIVMIYRLQEAGRDGNARLVITTMSTSTTTLQVLYTAVGIAAFVAVLAFVRQPRTLQRYTYTLGAIGLVLLALPAVLPASISEVPGTGAKIRISARRLHHPARASSPSWRWPCSSPATWWPSATCSPWPGGGSGHRPAPRPATWARCSIAWGVSLLVLVFETDIGTSALFFGLFVVMLYIATERTSWLIIGVSCCSSSARSWPASSSRTCRTAFTSGSTRSTYVHTHRLPDRARACTGWASAGVLGRGLGQGQPYLTPLVQSDFIITAFGEELGPDRADGAAAASTALIVQRGLRAAIAVRDPFSKLLAGGLAFVLALQVFVIVGGVTRLIPLTGITTPFLSQGGSSLVANWVLIALLMRISDTARRPAPQPHPGRGHDPGGAGRMNRALRRVSLICLVLFVLLLVNVNYVQGFKASSLATEPGNGRTFTAQLQFQRGSIITADRQGRRVLQDEQGLRLSTSGIYPYGPMYAPGHRVRLAVTARPRSSRPRTRTWPGPTPRWPCTTSST